MWGGIKDSGWVLVGGTLSEMSCPAFTKNELNSSAISLGSEMLPFGVTRLGMMFFLVGLRVDEVSSFRVSQVFFRVLCIKRDFSVVVEVFTSTKGRIKKVSILLESNKIASRVEDG